MNAIVPYHSDLGDVRVIDRDGEPWFVLSDLCVLLNIKNPTMAVKPLDDTERAKFLLGRQGEATIVSLPGMLTLAMRCRDALKPGTVPYRARKWITGDLVPQVLRTGSYGLPAPMADLNDNATLRTLLLGRMDRLDALEPKAEAFDRIADARGALTFTEAAKVLKVARGVLLDWLHRNRWIYRAPGNGRWIGYRDKETQGLVWHRASRLPTHDGPDKVVQSALITAKGLAKLAEIGAAR